MPEYFFKKIFLVLFLLINITSPSKGMLLENEENSVSGIVARILGDHIHDGATPYVGNDKKTIEWDTFLDSRKCSTCETALYRYDFLASGHPVPKNDLLINMSSPSKGMLLENEENSVSGIVARILENHIHDGATPYMGNDKKTIEWEGDRSSLLCDNCSTCETALYQYGFLASGHPVPKNELPFQQPTGSVLSKWFHNEDEEVCPITRFSLLPPYAPYIDKSKLMPGEPGYSLGFWNWQQIVTYRGIKMQRTTARSIWEEEQKNQEKVLDKKRQENYQKETKERKENQEKEIKRRQEKYQAEKKRINYEQATYEGNSLQHMRKMNGFGGTPRLEDLDPLTVKDLEEADRCNPARKKERAIIEHAKQQAENKHKEELRLKVKREQEQEEIAKKQPGYYEGSLHNDDLYDQDRFKSGRRVKAGTCYRGVPLDFGNFDDFF